MTKVVHLPQVLTVPEAAAQLKCSPPHIRKLIFTGKVRAFEISLRGKRAWRIDAASFAAYLEANAYQPPKPRALRRA